MHPFPPCCRAMVAGVCLAVVTLHASAANDTLTSDQKRRAEQLTSLFENDTTDLQYGYCANLKDGRGFTAGRAGFVTANDEVLRVVKVYAVRKPGNILTPYLPRLTELADEESSETSGLKGFPLAWKKAAEDPAFRKVQDELVEELFWQPTLKHARELHVRTAFGIAAIHDAIIQHGDDPDADGLPALLAETQKEAGGTPASGVPEKTWLLKFLEVRRRHLANAAEPETRKEWKASQDRCLVLESLVKSGNDNLTGPIVIESAEYEATIP